MKNKRVLISGMGIAGTTLAYWLIQYGFEPTIIELYPARRTGGYMIDFMGTGYDVAERMGIVQTIKGTGYRINEINMVNKRGRKMGSIRGDIFQKANEGRFVPILRGDLADAIFKTIEGKVETIFNDKIKTIEQNEDGVNITFEKSSPAHFDLMVGADGLHSGVRKQIFGPEETFEKYLGYYTAAFIANDYPYRDKDSYKGYFTPNHQVWRYSLPDNRTAFSFIFKVPSKINLKTLTLNEQKEFLIEAFTNNGWETSNILDCLNQNQELYFDSLSQIRIPKWHSGRIAFIGDACFAPSLVSGQGSSFAMASAYLLAGELKLSNGKFDIAFSNYQQKFENFITRRQEAAAKSLKWFAPKNSFHIWVNAKAINLLKIPIMRKMLMKGYKADRFTLPNYNN
jgi:2-polyprenyl-6-methoxyphenol hydroxylase-like FAD-dependent oxidoreductase